MKIYLIEILFNRIINLFHRIQMLLFLKDDTILDLYEDLIFLDYKIHAS